MSFFTPQWIQVATHGRWLRQPGSSAALAGVGTDTRDDLTQRAFIALRGERFDGHRFLGHAVAAGAGLLIVDERPRDHLPAGTGVLCVDDTRRALGAMARAYRCTLDRTTVIAVTGSVGKTTTKNLIHAALATTLDGTAAVRSFNNDIGLPLTLLGAKPQDDYVVVELGTNAPGEIAMLASIAEPDIAVFTTIGCAHLEAFGSIEGIAREKTSLLEHLRGAGKIVAGADSSALRNALSGRESVVWFGETDAADLRLTAFDHVEGQGRFEVNEKDRFELALPGRHNAHNALAALAVARMMSIDDDETRRAFARIGPASMRMNVAEAGGVRLYNDAYNASPESVDASMTTFLELAGDARRRIIVLGDMLELGAAAEDLHSAVGHRLAALDRARPIDRIILIGPRMVAAAAVLTAEGVDDRLIEFDDIDEGTIAGIAKDLRRGDAVLLKGSRRMGLERIADELMALSC